MKKQEQVKFIKLFGGLFININRIGSFYENSDKSISVYDFDGETIGKIDSNFHVDIGTDGTNAVLALVGGGK